MLWERLGDDFGSVALLLLGAWEELGGGFWRWRGIAAFAIWSRRARNRELHMPDSVMQSETYAEKTSLGRLIGYVFSTDGTPKRVVGARWSRCICEFTKELTLVYNTGGSLKPSRHRRSEWRRWVKMTRLCLFSFLPAQNPQRFWGWIWTWILNCISSP